MISSGAFKGRYLICSIPKFIENYDEAVADTSQIWHCHHRLETHFSDGTPRPVNAQLSRDELIALGMYYNRPPKELIFLTAAEHRSIHTKGKSHMGYKTHKAHKAHKPHIDLSYIIQALTEAGFTSTSKGIQKYCQETKLLSTASFQKHKQEILANLG